MGATLTLALLCLGASQGARALTLACSAEVRDPVVEQSRVREKALGLVRRVAVHRLEVQTQAGIRRFDDQPPHDEPLAGVHHAFYDRQEGLILVAVADGTRFTGLLVHEQAGLVTPGGDQVLLSPDGRAYLTVVQPDGLDGSEWAVHAIDGRRSWSGYSFILVPGSATTVGVWLSMPAWTSRGELTASAECPGRPDIRWSVKLVRRAGEADWDWLPRRACPAVGP